MSRYFVHVASLGCIAIGTASIAAPKLAILFFSQSKAAGSTQQPEKDNWDSKQPR